jgi:hypothetical protein
MSTVEPFNSFACNAMQAAKEADEPRERFVLLKLALEWDCCWRNVTAAAPSSATQSISAWLPAGLFGNPEEHRE